MSLHVLSRARAFVAVGEPTHAGRGAEWCVGRPSPPRAGRTRAPCPPRATERSPPSPRRRLRTQGDEEEEVKLYAYEGGRAASHEADIQGGDKWGTVTLLGERSGKGTATFPNGDTYTGEFVRGNRDGQGVYTYAPAAPPADGDEGGAAPAQVYDGMWKNGAKEGLGQMTYSSGDRYHGLWKNNLREGQGTMYYANGDVYTGEWLNDLKEGIGTYLYAESGASIKGRFDDGELLAGVFTDKFGNSYTGAFGGVGDLVAYIDGGAFTMANGATLAATGYTEENQKNVAKPKKKGQKKRKEPAPISWTSVTQKLPSGAGPLEKSKRKELFDMLDSDASGFIKLEECVKGVNGHMGDLFKQLPGFDLDPVIRIAFDVAKGVHEQKRGGGGGAADGADHVEFIEFRMLLHYLRYYFELYSSAPRRPSASARAPPLPPPRSPARSPARSPTPPPPRAVFEEIDTSDDQSISLDEFKSMVPKLKKWGVEITDAKKTFDVIDTSKNGGISFDEFRTWAVKHKLDRDDDDDAV